MPSGEQPIETSHLARRPDLLFFDIRMPGLGGLEAAAELADLWDTAWGPFPALVFVTAYDHHAVAAFEAQATDYLVKPVAPERLRRTVTRLQSLLAQRGHHPQGLQETTLAQLRTLLAPSVQTTEAPLRVLQVGVGTQIRMVPLEQVLAFDAADKYLRILTAQAEHLIRLPLKDLLPRLDTQIFWQVHRGTVVRADAIESVQRDEAGRLRLALRGLREGFVVSRLYASRFKAM